MTHTDLPHGVAWLLETMAVWNPLAISRLAGPEQRVREHFNRGTHGLSHDELRQKLRELFDSGDIVAYRSQHETGYNPTDEELDSALNDNDNSLWATASERGGARWESLAKPDWQRYFEDYYPREDTVELTAGSRSRLLEIIRNSELLWQTRIDPTLPEIEIVRPWPILGWKTLPEGFRVTVNYSEIQYPLGDPGWKNITSDENRAACAVVRSWATRICDTKQI